MSATVRPQNQGLSEIRCNINDHYVAGMRALYVKQNNYLSLSLLEHTERIPIVF